VVSRAQRGRSVQPALSGRGRLDGTRRGPGPNGCARGTVPGERLSSTAWACFTNEGQSRELASVPRPRQNGRETAVMSGHPTGSENGPGALPEGPAQLSYRRIRQASMALTPGSSPKRALASRLSMVRPV